MPGCGARGGGAPRRPRASRLARVGRVHADGRRARRDGASGRRRAPRGLALRPAERGVGALRVGTRQRRVRRDCARPGAGRRQPRRLSPGGCSWLPVGADRGPRSAGRVRGGPRGGPTAGGDAGKGVGHAARGEPGSRPRPRTPRGVDDQSADRPHARSDRGDPRSGRCATRRLCRGARQPRRLHPPSRDPGADPRRGARLRQVRAAPDVYPAGSHLESTAIALSRERVRRARLGLELLARSGYEPQESERGAAGLALPIPRTNKEA
jgi:hypothetical protein